jgi:hypothetical protein
MVKDTYCLHRATKAVEFFEKFYGPTMNAVDSAQNNGRADDLHKQLVELAKAHNEAKDVGASIPATFMRVTVSI